MIEDDKIYTYNDFVINLNIYLRVCYKSEFILAIFLNNCTF
jgi:hypothetical protein